MAGDWRGSEAPRRAASQGSTPIAGVERKADRHSGLLRRHSSRLVLDCPSVHLSPAGWTGGRRRRSQCNLVDRVLFHQTEPARPPRLRPALRSGHRACAQAWCQDRGSLSSRRQFAELSLHGLCRDVPKVRIRGDWHRGHAASCDAAIPYVANRKCITSPSATT
jgi:hypothetical protein